MDGGFTASQDHDFATGGKGVLCQGLGIDLLGGVVGMPSTNRITPRALDRATVKANEIGRLAEVAALSLPSVETFVDGEQFHG